MALMYPLESPCNCSTERLDAYTLSSRNRSYLDEIRRTSECSSHGPAAGPSAALAYRRPVASTGMPVVASEPVYVASAAPAVPAVRSEIAHVSGLVGPSGASYVNRNSGRLDGSSGHGGHDESKSKLKTFLSTSRKSNHKAPNEQQDNTDKVKTKILSMWNNVKYGWTVKVKTNFSKDSAIWLLGKCYHNRSTLPQDVEKTFEEFRMDFYSRIWLTYRREFPSLAGSTLTTDCGWGCMLRSGQMMLAEAFVRHFLGREWTCNSRNCDDGRVHRDIIRWFGDMKSDISPFSLHHLVALGESSGKKAGDWYGPASVAHILRQAMDNASVSHPRLNELCIYVAQDCTVYQQDVLDLCLKDDCTSSASPSSWRGIIILIPVRLGGEAFNPVYMHCLQQILSAKNCIGIIGGRPRHSLYFIGWQDEKLIHLDPHYCQEVVDVTIDYYDVQTFHCSSPRKMSFSRMDPSCTIGFYCQSKKEFNEFITLSEMVRSSQHGQYPVFIVSEGRSADCTFQNYPSFHEETLNYWHLKTENSFDSDDETEEFVVI